MTETEIYTILHKPHGEWTDADAKAVRQFADPLRKKPLSHMTHEERLLLLNLYMRYCWKFDERRRAIAYAMLTEQFTASELGQIRLHADTVEGAIRCSPACDGDPNSGFFVDDEVIMGMRCLQPQYAIEYPRPHKESVLFGMILHDYLWKVRGFKPGPLFAMERGRKGDTAPRPISMQAALRVLAPATAAFGLNGHGQSIQFARIADGLEYLFNRQKADVDAVQKAYDARNPHMDGGGAV